MSDNKTTCPKCFGQNEVFNGKRMKECDLCEDGEVSNEVEEAFIKETLPYV